MYTSLLASGERRKGRGSQGRREKEGERGERKREGNREEERKREGLLILTSHRRSICHHRHLKKKKMMRINWYYNTNH